VDGNGDLNDNKGPVFREAKTHIPLDDRGIDEQRAMEHIQSALTEALAHPAKVEGVVFGIIMEADAEITAPNGEKSVSFLAMAGSAQWQAALAYALMESVVRMQQESGEPEGI